MPNTIGHLGWQNRLGNLWKDIKSWNFQKCTMQKSLVSLSMNEVYSGILAWSPDMCSYHPLFCKIFSHIFLYLLLISNHSPPLSAGLTTISEFRSDRVFRRFPSHLNGTCSSLISDDTWLVKAAILGLECREGKDLDLGL